VIIPLLSITHLIAIGTMIGTLAIVDYFKTTKTLQNGTTAIVAMRAT